MFPETSPTAPPSGYPEAFSQSDKLIREDNPYLDESYVYTYDNAGNRTSKKTYAYTTGTLGTVTSTQTYTYSTGTWGDQLIQIKTNDVVTAYYDYDAIGNPTTYNGYALEWNGRQLMKMSMSGGQIEYTFQYNDQGIRTSKISSGVEHRYTLNGTQIVAEQFGSHYLVYLYDESGAPIGLQYRVATYSAGEFDTYYFEKNIFGDIIAVYTEAGVKIGSYTYDAWGNCTPLPEPDATTFQKRVVRSLNPFRYRGYYYDTETGLYYLQSRYYNPATGRFINADGYINANGDLIGFNMYAYCSNNPVMYMDESGESVTVICLFLLGTAIAGGILGAVYTCNEANKNNEEVKPLDMIKNITFGFGAGLAIGGAIVSMGAVFAGLGAAATAGTMTAGLKAVFWGVTVKQAFSIGALAIHAFTDVILPLFGGSMDAPEYEQIPQPQQPSPYIPYTHPAYY